MIGSEPRRPGRILTGAGEKEDIVCDGKDEQRRGNGSIHELTYNLTPLELGIYGKETEDKRLGSFKLWKALDAIYLVHHGNY